MERLKAQITQTDFPKLLLCQRNSSLDSKEILTTCSVFDPYGHHEALKERYARLCRLAGHTMAY